MSALPPKADIGTQLRNVRCVPIADIASPFFSETISRFDSSARRDRMDRLTAKIQMEICTYWVAPAAVLPPRT